MTVEEAIAAARRFTPRLALACWNTLEHHFERYISKVEEAVLAEYNATTEEMRTGGNDDQRRARRAR